MAMARCFPPPLLAVVAAAAAAAASCTKRPLPLSFSPPPLPSSSHAVLHHFLPPYLPPYPHSFHSPFLCLSSSSSSPSAQVVEQASDLASQLDSLDIRVGKIVKAWKHPEADSLYVEEVDVGETAGPRTICSGLVKYVPEEELPGRAVLVLANLKPRNMRGVKSNGMLLAASDAAHEHVELLIPPEGSIPGERVWFGSETDRDTQIEAATPNQVQKKKVWETVQPKLKTTDECVATFEGKPMRTSAGLVTCKTLSRANIS